MTANPGTRIVTKIIFPVVDMEAAIAEGATWVRIGTALFGRRD